MAIKTIKGKKYYYRNRRIGKQVISEYIGTGHTALLMSQLDEHEREQAKLRRRAWKEIQRREAAIDAQIDELGDHIKALVDAHLIISGMHQHKREWRRKRAQLNDDFFEIVKATHKEKPKQEDIVKLKQFLVEHPDYCSRFGNLAVQVEVHICENAFKQSQATLISIDKYCKQMRTDLGFNEASALEKSLIEHVVLCWLRLYTAELRYEMNMQTNLALAQGEYWEKKLGYNQKRYLRSVETLARVRRLMQKAPTPVMNTLIMQNPSPATNDLLQAFSQGLGGK